MDFYRIFNAIKSEYPENIALAAVQVYTLNLSLKSRLDGKFEEKIIKKARKILWQMSQNDLDLAVNIWRVAYTWECRQALQGMGGCKAKTFKQLLAESQHYA